MNKKLLSINMFASFLAFMVSFGINFFLSPYIVENLGSESYAFVKLSNDFIMYVTLASTALNSMASRYISVSFLSNKIEEANEYYSSVFYANILLCLIVGGCAIVPVIILEKIISIPNNLITDVKIVFCFVLINFIIGTVFSVFGVGVFIKNRLYLNNIRSIESGIFRAIFLFALFYFFKPHIYYIVITTIIITVYTGLYNLYYTKKLVPELKLSKKRFKFDKIKNLISSGIWNVISQLSYILNEGLDLLISNIFIGSAQMGVLAVAKTLPNMVTSVYSSISSVFMPDLTKLYAQNKMEQMKIEINNSIKILGVIVNIPVVAIIVFGKEFYRLWVPSQDANMLHILSILTVLCIILSGSTVSIHNIFTIANKVKINSLVTIGVGIFNTLAVLLLVNLTDLGVFAVAGVSSSTAIIRNLIFTFPYAAKCIKAKWTAFYWPALRGVLCCGLGCIISVIVKNIITVNSWGTFIIAVGISSLLGFIFNILIVTNKQERKKIIEKFKTERK